MTSQTRTAALLLAAIFLASGNSFADNVALPKDDLIVHTKGQKYPHGPMLHYINQERAKSNLSSLRRIKELDSLCVSHAKDIATMDQMNHQGSDGRWPWERAGFKSDKLANENIGWIDKANENPLKASEFHQAFMNSPGHRSNILNPDWRYFGIHYVASVEKDKYFVVCLFSLNPPLSVRNAESSQPDFYSPVPPAPDVSR